MKLFGLAIALLFLSEGVVAGEVGDGSNIIQIANQQAKRIPVIRPPPKKPHKKTDSVNANTHDYTAVKVNPDNPQPPENN